MLQIEALKNRGSKEVNYKLTELMSKQPNS